jgi:hypothetical protein
MAAALATGGFAMLRRSFRLVTEPAGKLLIAGFAFHSCRRGPRRFP